MTTRGDTGGLGDWACAQPAADVTL